MRELWDWQEKRNAPKGKPLPEPTENGVKPSEPIQVLEDRNASTTIIKQVAKDIWERISRRG
jgi:hypothetical protein